MPVFKNKANSNYSMAEVRVSYEQVEDNYFGPFIGHSKTANQV